MARVMVLTMHEAQRAEAQGALQNCETTDGYVVGDGDDAAIAKLRADGMIVTELDAPPEPTAVPQAFGPGGGGPQLPGYVTAWVQQPVLPEYHKQLAAAGVQLTEGRGSRFVFHVKDAAQLAALEAFSWVRNVKPYDLEDTLKGMGGRGTVTARWDLLLHEGADWKTLKKSLDDMPGVKLISHTAHKVQIQASERDAQIAGDNVEVASVLPWKPPTLRVDRARVLTRAATAAAPQVHGGPLTGKGVVIGVADTGLDDGHPAFKAKKPTVIAKGRAGVTDDPHGHGTHVAGTICGDPPAANANLAGIAPAAQLVFQSVLDESGGLGGIGAELDPLLEEAYKAGVRIHNNSWGADTEGAYAASSYEIDRFVWKHPDMLVVVAAGNAGTIKDPPAGKRRSLPGDVDWFSVGAPGTSKNALVVGASRSDREDGGYAKMTFGAVWPDRFAPPATFSNETVSGDPEKLAAFSSRGLSDDQRIKPDVVAPGTDIAAPRSAISPSYHFAGMVPKTNRMYGYMSGTSMATPIASGIAALLAEYLARERKLAKPSAALMKAILINGARPLGGAGAQTNPQVVPNPHQGFGCLDLARSIPIDPASGFRLAFEDSWSANQPPFMKGNTATRRRFQLTTKSAAPLSVTLAYTDYYARSAQNNLSLILEAPPAAKAPPALGNASLQTLIDTMKLPDATNNVEKITIDNAPAGVWTVTVIATTILQDPQHYALAVTGDLDSDQLKAVP